MIYSTWKWVHFSLYKFYLNYVRLSLSSLCLSVSLSVSVSVSCSLSFFLSKLNQSNSQFRTKLFFKTSIKTLLISLHMAYYKAGRPEHWRNSGTTENHLEHERNTPEQRNHTKPRTIVAFLRENLHFTLIHLKHFLLLIWIIYLFLFI